MIEISFIYIFLPLYLFFVPVDSGFWMNLMRKMLGKTAIINVTWAQELLVRDGMAIYTELIESRRIENLVPFCINAKQGRI